MIQQITTNNAIISFDIQKLINNIHEHLLESQGLIEAKNGITKRGYKYIYYIVKKLSEEQLGGIQYFLHLNLAYENDVVEIKANFTEIGMTGVREAVCVELAKKAGLTDVFMDSFKDWSKDPYDSEYSKGILKNLSEKEGLDRIFPEHPLSQAHEFLLSVLEDKFVTIKSENNEKGNDATEDSEEFLSNLFVDECRRHTYIVEVTDCKKPNVESENLEKNNHFRKENISKRKQLDEKLKESINEYNEAYTYLNDHGIKLFNQRERGIDLLENIENLINSIANHPKEFDSDIAEINVKKLAFRDVCDFAKEELEQARKSAASVSTGIAGGLAVASVAPSAALWIATTFGTASTGTAISTLSGAAATNAALAWLGGGAIAVGGGGMSTGSAFLALAGPIGWGIAGATLLTSVVLFANKKMKLDKEKKQEINTVLENTEKLKEVDADLEALLRKTIKIREGLNDQYAKGIKFFGRDFMKIDKDGQLLLGSIVNNAKALSISLGQGVKQ